jgi:hypothetical protein
MAKQERRYAECATQQPAADGGVSFQAERQQRPARGEYVRAEDGAETPRVHAGIGSAAEQVARLRRLIDEQADELSRAESSLREITAICDLADWANDSMGSNAPTVVLVDDLRRVLAARLGAGT